MNRSEELLAELARIEQEVSAYIRQNAAGHGPVQPEILESSLLSYVNRSGKKLRPAILYLACEAVGGDPQKALPACAAVELYHTWTLVHDDVIDNDDMRRGVPTVHCAAAQFARTRLGLAEAVSVKYGSDVAMLTGDVQHGWSISMLAGDLPARGTSAEVALNVIYNLQTRVLRVLAEGEMLDVDFSLFRDVEDLSEEDILDMLWKKTGVLYEFAGRAGAMIGKNSVVEDAEVIALKEFASLCGAAFQVVDDNLGLVGKEAELGKPVGSDLREGKKTIPVRHALRTANAAQRKTILDVLGDRSASDTRINEATQVVVDLGGVAKAHGIARHFVDRALPHLEVIKPSRSRDLLEAWAHYMVERNY